MESREEKERAQTALLFTHLPALLSMALTVLPGSASGETEWNLNAHYPPDNPNHHLF